MQFEEEQVSAMGNEKPSTTGFSQTRLENTSFAITPERLILQAVTPEQIAIRLHAPQVRIMTLIELHPVIGDCPAEPRRTCLGGEAME